MFGWNVSFWELWPGGFRLVLRSLMALGECRTNRHSCSTYMACVELLGLREEQRLSEHTLATSVNSRITIVSPQILQIQARPNKVRMRMGTRTDDKTSRSPRTTTRGVSPCQHKHCTTSNKESETKSTHPTTNRKYSGYLDVLECFQCLNTSQKRRSLWCRLVDLVSRLVAAIGVTMPAR